MSVSEWIESTNAIGLIVRKGKYGGTYAQKDIAFEFGTAISVQFKLYLINEFQRLKAAEWRESNPTLPGNVLDYATVNQLICLSNMESLNSVLINEGLPQSENFHLHRPSAPLLGMRLFVFDGFVEIGQRFAIRFHGQLRGVQALP